MSAIGDTASELGRADEDEPTENCPHPGCGGHLLNDRCTAAECPALRRSCHGPRDDSGTCSSCARRAQSRQDAPAAVEARATWSRA